MANQFANKAERDAYLRGHREQAANRNKRLLLTVFTAVLIAVGILIPIISPLKLVLEPASFTLASHVALFVATFLSPFSAFFVAVGTTVGFMLSGMPPVIWARAGSQVIFAMVGALIVRRRPEVLDRFVPMALLAAGLSIIHGVGEVLAVIPFYFGGMLRKYEARGFAYSVLLMVGAGTFVHSMVDFYIARAVWQPLRSIARRRGLLPEITDSKT